MFALVLLMLVATAAARARDPHDNHVVVPHPQRRPHENYGTVDLFERKNFKGIKASVAIVYPNACYNLDCFNNTASSAMWDLPADGVYNNGTAYLAMYSKSDCKGDRYIWDLHDFKNDSNLRVDAHMNDQVTSVMVMKTAMNPSSFVRKCSGGTTVFNGSASAVYE